MGEGPRGAGCTAARWRVGARACVKAAPAALYALLVVHVAFADGASSGAPLDPGVGLPAPAETAPAELDLSPGGWLSAFHRERKNLKDLGITFSLHERSEVWADVTGGGHRGFSYDGLTTAKLDVDLDKA